MPCIPIDIDINKKITIIVLLSNVLQLFAKYIIATNIINPPRLSAIIEKLDKLVDHVLVYTNQNYDYNLSGRFFDEMKIRIPNYYFSKEAISFSDFLSNAIIEFEKILIAEKPDKILILGDTNSGLLAILTERYKIPVYHMEAGNRCFDDRLPEEGL